MRHTVITSIAFLILFLPVADASCTSNSCPPGYQCDTNTGICRQFRVPSTEPAIPGPTRCPVCQPGYVCNVSTGQCVPVAHTSLCDNVVCPNGYQCDSNTGICRQFRQPNTGTTVSPSLCSNVVCMEGYQCDPNSGQCVQFRYPDEDNKCASITCPIGYSCDSNTGKCVHFRSPGNEPALPRDKCATVLCPIGYVCDSNTGFCTQFRQSTPPIVNPNDKCSGVICPTGTRCDSNTGKCAQFRNPVQTPAVVDKCKGFSCPAGYFCDSTSGACRLSMVLNPTTRSTPLNKCAGVNCPAGQQCDSNTGLCRGFRNSGESRNACAGVTCPRGQFCDSNTGQCRAFRITTINEDDMSLCANVKCPSGQACDSNTGKCRSFAMAATTSKCGNCPAGTRCDENTGKCQTFRQPLRFAKLLEKMVDSCKNVTCEVDEYCRDGECYRNEVITPEGKSTLELITTVSPKTEENTQDIRDLIAAELLRILKAEDPCDEVKCEDGKMCDRQTGTCERVESPQIDLCSNQYCPDNSKCDPGSGQCVTLKQIDPEGVCSTITCPADTKCDSGSGSCVSLRHSGSIPVAPSPSTINRDPCQLTKCPKNTKCDSATGRCAVIHMAPSPSAILPSKDRRIALDLCWNVDCPPSSTCDASSGVCRHFRGAEAPNQDVPRTTTTHPLITRFFPEIEPLREQSFGIQVGDQLPASCTDVNCPAGTECEPRTGICRRIRRRDLCAHLQCEEGYECNERSGNCEFVDIGCGKKPCPSLLTCDSRTGKCVVPRSVNPNPCFNVTCNEQSRCDPSTGQCMLAVECPRNSVFVECGSPCPFTCTDIDSCRAPCVPTCQCKDGYVQKRKTDFQCVPSNMCLRNRDVCRHVKCAKNDVCVDGLCHPRSCPLLQKPAIRADCSYAVERNSRTDCLHVITIC